MADYSYEVDLDVRLRDIDFMGHVNNATYATYLEQAREAYFRDVLGVSLVEVGTVLVNLEIDYVRPIEADDDVTVGVDPAELGTSSLPLEYEIRADGKRAATARTVQVVRDEETGTSRSLPSEWRERIDRHRD
ncbi:acyl-CoA thioesterase [Natronobacterium texcoconense]|uniref:Acyl-CoA thioester hydrolase n=1 Tax=Natronobacterium texcoconense TaxID=1095778 RepID=A0A1H1CN09_NATTX|nr:thioesterase family protein [Natronobacterium texcoconense]SDQ65562.1 acyl-CoA thioester hydrolase [Natronobacterium texcoconense]